MSAWHEGWAEQLALLPDYGRAHLRLSLLALACGAGVAIPLGVAVSRRARLEPWVLSLAGVVQTIPSLALLALMVPLLSALGLQGIGFLPAWVALTLYSILPMLSNTVTGLAGVDPAVVEAARGVGMTGRQSLLRVELPLALPVVVAGVRTAAVWVVGTATLATPVGATSLGNFIFAGLQTRNTRAVIVGSVAAAALALVLDALVRRIESGLRLRRARRWGSAVAALGLLAAVAFVGAGGPERGGAGAAAPDAPVVIGAKAFTEQYVLAALLAETIEEQTGAPTRRVDSLGSTVAFDALRSGAIDVYVDYSGTIWATILGGRGRPPSRAELLEQVRQGLSERHGIAVAAALGFENTYALAMTGGRAQALGIRTISDLVRHSRTLSMGADYEFFSRAEWKALQPRYGLAFREQRSMDPALMYPALVEGAVDVISAFSTDGRIAAYGLRLLEDDAGVIPPYDAIVLVGARLQRERPDVVRALAALDGRIDEAQMQRMNAAVDEQGRAPAAVAHDFLAGAASTAPAVAGPGGT